MDFNDWMAGIDDVPPLAGERLSVLDLEQNLITASRTGDRAASLSTPVQLPAAVANKDWPQAGGSSTNAMHHLSVSDQLPTIRWRQTLEKGADDIPFLSLPVVAHGRLYALDAAGHAVALHAETGQILWRTSLIPDGETVDNALGGGVAFYQGGVYITTGFGSVIALDAQTGQKRWTHEVGQPFRSAPTVSGGAVIAISFDNQIHVLRIENGDKVWAHATQQERTGLMGGAAPAVADQTVYAAFSNGSLIAFDLKTGTIVWQESLVRRGRVTTLQGLADIDGLPVVDRGLVFGISHSGRMVALTQEAGEPVWSRDIGGRQTPWVVGEYVYVLTSDGTLVCLTRSEGRIRWSTALLTREDTSGPQTRWSGPVLASDRLILTSSDGQAVSVSPYDGRVLGTKDLSGATDLPPIIANQWVYILTNQGEIIALY